MYEVSEEKIMERLSGCMNNNQLQLLTDRNIALIPHP